LSATLPNRTRNELIAAYVGEQSPNHSLQDYPRVTLANSQGVQVHSLNGAPARMVKIFPVDYALENIVDLIKERIADGGCIAMVCNRVKRAQEIYQAVKQAKILPEENLVLFHARF